MRLYATNCHQFGSGTLLEAIHDMVRFESDNPAEEASVFEAQCAAYEVLISRGWVYNEDEDDMEYELS